MKKRIKPDVPMIFQYDGAKLREDQILELIQTDQFFGLCKVSIEIPENKRSKWRHLNFPPIINKRSIREDECTDEMLRLLKKRGIKFPLGKPILIMLE